jgi:hypothetical protein
MWAVTPREKRNMKVFEDRLQRKIFGPTWDEVTGDKLHNEESNDLCSSPNIFRVIKPRRMRWVGHVACTGEKKGGYRVIVGRPEAQRPRVRPWHRWDDNIKTDFKEARWEA